MKQLYEQHRVLLRIGIILTVLILLWGSVEIISVLQYNKRESIRSPVISMEEHTEEIKAYDVTGLEQEEIDEALEKQREIERRQEE